MALAKENSGKAIALPVSVPSHCSLMKPAAEQFAPALEQTAIELPRIPVLQNVGAQAATNVDELRQALTAQLCSLFRIKGSNMLQSVVQAMFWQTWQNVYLILKKHFHSIVNRAWKMH